MQKINRQTAIDTFKEIADELAKGWCYGGDIDYIKIIRIVFDKSDNSLRFYVSCTLADDAAYIDNADLEPGFIKTFIKKYQDKDSNDEYLDCGIMEEYIYFIIDDKYISMFEDIDITYEDYEY